MAAWVSKQTGNWTRTSGNTDSPWYDGGAQTDLARYPGSVAGDTVTIGDGVTATQIITLDADPAASLASITGGDSTSYVACATTRALTLTANPGSFYAGTNTSGLVRVTANTLTITHNQGAGTTAVSATAAGYAIVTSGSGTIAVSNSGGKVASVSSSGRAIYTTGTGGLILTGDIELSGSGIGVYAASTGVSSTWAGSAISSGTNTPLRLNAGTLTWTPGTTGVTVSGGNGSFNGLYLSGGTLVIAAKLATANTGTINQCYPVFVTGATVTYVGDYTLADGEDCVIGMVSGTLNLATATDNLVLTNNGSFVIIKQSGALTYNADGGTASIVNAKTTSYAAIIGGSAAQKAIITGPTLPAAGDVDNAAANYGYAGALVDPTCVLPAEADVETGVQYGAAGTEFTGTLAAGAGSRTGSSMSGGFQ